MPTENDATTLLVASAGGHLAELIALAPRLVPQGPMVWAVPDSPQARDLLAGESVDPTPDVPQRDVLAALRTIPRALMRIRRHRVRRIVSTGAGLAVPFFVVGRALGIECHYVESAARVATPSLTGSTVSRLPGVRLYAQYRTAARHAWHYRGSVFDCYQVSEQASPGPRRARRIVVTLGTMRAYDYGRAVAAVLRLLPQIATRDVEVLWQTGCTDVSGFPIEGHDFVDPSVLADAMEDADLVIAHAGVGSALMALDHGKCPILLPRKHQYGEHVDDHQQLIADELSGRGLAIQSDPDAFTAADVTRAMATVISPNDRPSPFVLLSDEHAETELEAIGSPRTQPKTGRLAALKRAVSATGLQARLASERLLRRRATPLQIVGGDRILVVTPHPDDETLGAGALMAHAAQVGAQVRIVAATRGAHAAGVQDVQLAQARAGELLEAAEALGLAREDVRQLDLPDGALGGSLAELTDVIAEEIDRFRPTIVAVTALEEPHPDHAAAAQALRAALRRTPQRPLHLEYPVWLWASWPFSSATSLSKGAVSLARSRMLSVPVNGVARVKSAALDAHATQMGAAGDTLALPPDVVSRAQRDELYFVIDDPAKVNAR